MISHTKHILTNGLKLIVHQDKSTPMAGINLLYDVGSKDEQDERTGSAHLLEHMMFGGSPNVKSYDIEVQKAGGESNAYTTNDFTNYYILLPSVNLETGFWLESDRMLDLRFTEKVFTTQKKVVIEEFKQRCLNQPYGDVWHLLRPMVYSVHPYKWPVIGVSTSHIDNISLNDIKEFYYEHYCPSKAILSIAGNVDPEKCINLAEKWFGTIARRKRSTRRLPSEPEQINRKTLEVTRNVPCDELILAFRMSPRKSAGYYNSDLISDLLAGGKSSVLFRQLVIEKEIFGTINAFLTGDMDPGLFIIRGRLATNIKMENALEEILKVIDNFRTNPPEDYDLEKVKNKLEATKSYAYTDIVSKSADLGYYELIGEAGQINDEIGLYRQVTSCSIMDTARTLFSPDNSSILYYYSEQK